MELLISPSEVKEIAFAGSQMLTEEAIPEATILAAQQKFIRPVVGKLYAELENGKYPKLMTPLKAALAQYVRMLLLPQMGAMTGDIGIVQPKAGHFDPAGDNCIASLKNAARTQACALMRQVVECIEADPEAYPEYDAEDNVLNRTSICSKIVL